MNSVLRNENERKKRGWRIRMPQLLFGLVLYGFSSALMVRADLGLPPWSVFHQGVSIASGVSFGMAILLTGVGVLLLWVPLQQRIGIGTLLNVAIIGPAADGSLELLPTPRLLVARVLMLGAGIVLTGVATGLYIGAGYEAGPRDGIMTGLAHRTGFPLRAIRAAIEIGVLAIGFLLGGTVGVGTVVYAVTIGPVVQFFLAVFGWKKPSPLGERSGAPALGERSLGSDLA